MNANAPNPNPNPTTEPADPLRRRPLGVWLYAVTDSRDWETGQLPPGVAGEPVHRVDTHGLTAVVGTVDLVDFGEEALRRKLEDLDWLAAAARAHDRVVNAVAQHGATVPVGLATVFSSDDNVRALLDARRANLTAALRHLAGRTEWGVKAYADPEPAPMAATGATPGTSAAEEGAGTAFLKRRRAQLAKQQSAVRISAEQADRIHARLTQLSVGSRRYAPQNPELTGRREQMLLNGAYLVDDERLGAFRSAVAEIDSEGRREGVRVQLTGPWPSYSFTAEGLTDG